MSVEISRVIVVDEENKILLGKRATGKHIGKWHILGGEIEGNENAFSAAQRELYEEAGLCIFPILFLSSEHQEKMSYYFLAQTSQTEVPKDDKEIDQLKWFSLED